VNVGLVTIVGLGSIQRFGDALTSVVLPVPRSRGQNQQLAEV